MEKINTPFQMAIEKLELISKDYDEKAAKAYQDGSNIESDQYSRFKNGIDKAIEILKVNTLAEKSIIIDFGKTCVTNICRWQNDGGTIISTAPKIKDNFTQTFKSYEDTV